MRYFMIIMGFVITLMFLLAILAGSAQAGDAALIHKDAQPIDVTPLVYLGFAGGTAILAGIVWLRTLQQAQKSTTEQ